MTHILIVEDEAALRGDLVDFLALSGYEASGVASAAKLRSELDCGALPQVVILDVGLPDAGGFDLARNSEPNRLRHHHADRPWRCGKPDQRLREWR